MARLPRLQGKSLRDRLAELIRPRRLELIAATLLQGIAVGLGLVPPLLLGALVDGYVAQEPLPLGSTVLLLVGALTIGAVTGFLASRVAFACGEAIFADLRYRFFRDVLELPLTTVEGLDSGEILSRTTSDLDAVHEVARTGVPETLVGIVTTVVTLTMAFFVNPWVALGTLVGFPFIVVSTRWYVRRAPEAYEAELASTATLITEATESVRGARTVHVLDLVAVRRRRYRRAAAQADDAARRPLGLEARWFPAVQLGYHLPTITVLAIGVPLVGIGSAQIGEVASIALFMRTIILPLDDVIYWFGETQSAVAAFGRILGVPARSGGQQQTSTPSPRESRAGVALLELDTVTYAYPNGQGAVQDVSLTVHPGERICVVGSSGAGKTTLGLLVIGALLPTHGRITLNGRPSEPGDGKVAMVTQEDYVFAATLRQNVALGESDAAISDDRAWMCLDAAGASWARENEGGLGIDFTRGDVELSAMQARQVALARVLYSRPQLLVLDEVTASLPAATVQHFQDALPTILPDAAVLQIAHDLETARHADRIVVMEDGSIVEIGAHDELLQRHGRYEHLWSLTAGARR